MTLALGYPHPDYLLPLLSSRQIFEWMLYANIEPFGSPRDDERAGVVASVIANVNRDPKKRREAFLPADFFAREAVAPPEPMDLGARIQAGVRAALKAAERRPGRVRQEPRE